ncbi:MAG: polyprenyl synthetase family protein [Patescibacteria group bacterium]
MAAPAALLRYADLIEDGLRTRLGGETGAPPVLLEAMRYSACGAGKRIRGALALGACAAVGGREEDALPAACALEMVHAFSLIHDDLPCMDNDDYRRGKPSCHKAFGEAYALLAGDALLVQGLAALAGSPGESARILAATRILLAALGPAGMIGGQVLDMQAEGKRLDPQSLRALHAAKTGALIRAAAAIGATLAGAGEARLAALDAYAASLGLAFQIIDDLLDAAGDAAALGKTPGGDARNAKAAFPSLLGLEASRRMAGEEIGKALAALEGFPGRADFLAELARYVEGRMPR